MLLLVLPLCMVLVALYFLGGLAGLVEMELPGVLGADGDMGQQPLQLATMAFRTFRSITGPHELFELMVAGATLVFVDRHG